MTDCCTLPANGAPGGGADVAIIGAGSAGFAAAIRAAELGARAVLIGHGTIGGTCVNVGCVPSKTLIRAVEALHQARAAPRFEGIWADARLVDWARTIAQKDALVDTLRHAKYIDLLSEYENVAYREGWARLTPDGIAVNGETLKAGKVIITTGASPATPRLPGLAGVPWLTSTTALELRELPASLLVIGGGAVGCELGQLFARAGAKVTIVCRSRLLPYGEPEISEALAGYLRDEGISVRCGVRYRAIRAAGEGVELDLEDSDRAAYTLTAERVLVAAGRTPNTAGLDLERAGVALTPEGAIAVDDRMRTTRAGTYAAGDVTGRDMFVYMAAYGAKLAADNALHGDSRRYDATSMPQVVFTDPQAASVGLTETAARAHGLDVRTMILQLDQVPRALAARDTRGLIKLVAERDGGRLVGAHILAPEAGDSIQTAVLAIKHNLTVHDLADTLFPYLTTVEGLKLAALGFSKDVAKLSCCAG
jgi:mercuric reductase